MIKTECLEIFNPDIIVPLVKGAPKTRSYLSLLGIAEESTSAAQTLHVHISLP